MAGGQSKKYLHQMAITEVIDIDFDKAPKRLALIFPVAFREINKDLNKLLLVEYALEHEIKSVDKELEYLADNICDMEDDLRFDLLKNKRNTLLNILNIITKKR